MKLIKKADPDLCEGPFLRKIILYTVPIILTSLLQLLFNAADLIVLGNFCGGHSVGAVGATGSLINLMVNLFFGLSVGAGVCVAQRIGAKDDAAVFRAVHTAIPTALISGIILTAVGVPFSGTFLEWMGTPEDIIDLSALYLRIYFAGILPILVYNFGAAILRAAGDTTGPLLFLMIAGVVNEPIRLLENAPEARGVSWLLAPQVWLEHLFVRRPHPQMVEVAVLAWNAAQENAD